jgi:hypothetical protein
MVLPVARAMARRDVAAALLPLTGEDRRSVLIDSLLEFDPEMFAAVEAVVRIRAANERACIAAKEEPALGRTDPGKPVVQP